MPLNKATTARQSRETEQIITGSLSQFIFSPKGSIEGLYIAQELGPVQIVTPPDIGNALMAAVQVGHDIAVRVDTDDEADNDGLHPVHRFVALLGNNGKPVKLASAVTDGSPITGTVARLNFAKHGEANGVILENGDFIHLKPDGMARAKLSVGDTVSAVGKLRPHVLGGVVCEAESVNGKTLQKKKPH